MRIAGPLGLALAWVAVFAARPAAARDARDYLWEARAALSAEPPRRDAARVALEKAAADARGQDAAEAFFLLGEVDEGDAAFARALADDLASVAAAPEGPWARAASERAEWLRARSEGDFAPLARLERVRRDPSLARDPTAIEALEGEAESFPAGVVRVEARMLVAEAWLRRFNRTEAALAELRKVTRDPLADPLTAGLAQQEIVEALVGLRKLDEAATEARARPDLLDPRFVALTLRIVRRRWLARGAFLLLASFAILAGIALGRALRRRALGDAKQALKRTAPLAAAFALYVAGAGGLLASRYEAGSAVPFILVGGAALPLALIARAWGAVGSQHPAARLGRALLCGTSVIAATFVLLDAVGPAYLEGFGL